MIKKLIASVLLFFFALNAFAEAGTCVKISGVCSQPDQTRWINGQPVFRSCWEYSDSYECYENQPSDTCAPLRAIQGCYEYSNDCLERNYKGVCVKFKTIMRCNTSIAPPANVTVLPPNYTVITDIIQPSPECSALRPPECTKVGQTCIEGPATRNINGLPIYKECWKYRDEYKCTVPSVTDYCQPLIQAGCTKVAGPNCILTAPNGYCAEETNDYRCIGDQPLNPPPPNVTFINKDVVINNETIDSTCDQFRNSPFCTRMSGPTCVDGPSTKYIKGQPIYRACWRWEEQFKCVNPDRTDSDCDAVANNPKCTLKKTDCILRLPNGTCTSTEKTYSCEVKPAGTKPEEVCRTRVCDANGVCVDADDQPDKDFGPTAAGLEIAREIGVYLDSDGINIFSGEDSRCSKGKLGIKSCCTPKGGGQSNNALAGAMFEGLTTGGKEVMDVGSKYMYDSLMDSPTLQEGMGSMISSVNSWFTTSPDYDFFNGSFDPSFSYMGFSASWGAAPGASPVFNWASQNIPGVGSVGSFINSGNIVLGGTPPGFVLQFNPYMLLAQLIIDWVLTCAPSDHITALRKGQNLCHHVGSYCHTKFLGACLEMRESHCCYNSRLAKIIQEQGRMQINKSWGSPEAPVCKGFTIAEMESLDFSKMDLSEFIKEIQAKAINTIPGTSRAQNNIANHIENYFGQRAGNVHASPTGNALNWSTPKN